MLKESKIRKMLKEKIVELDGGENVVFVYELTSYNGKIYALCFKLDENEEPVNESAIYRVEEEPDGLYLAFEDSQDVLEKIVPIFLSLFEQN